MHSLNYPSNKKVYVDNDCQAAWHSVRKSCLIFVKFISRILSFHHENTTVLLQNREWSSFSICLLICHTRKLPGQVTGCCTFLVFFAFCHLFCTVVCCLFSKPSHLFRSRSVALYGLHVPVEVVQTQVHWNFFAALVVSKFTEFAMVIFLSIACHMVERSTWGTCAFHVCKCRLLT